jgi:hypothetical protein
MKAYLKNNKTQIGLVTKVYITTWGQKRMEVRFSHSIVDAAVSNFEVL